MTENEKIKEIEKTERQKIKESIRLRKEKEKLGEFEKAVVECPECKSHILVHDYKRAELVCNECGLVVGADFIDHGPEWGALDYYQTMKRCRVGAPMTYTIHDKGLSTMIDWRNCDSYGKSISSQTRAQLYHLRRWQRRIRLSNATERNLAFALSELDRMESALGLSQNVRESAAFIYRKAVKKNLIRGRSIEGVGSAALYAACRQRDIPRTLNEISEVSRVSKKEIGRTYRLISKKLGLKLIPISPVEYVPRFCSGLNLHGEIQAKIIEILRQASEKELTNGRDPVSVAAAAIYIASILFNDRRIQSEIAKVARTTEVTIRNRYKELVNGLGIEMLL